MSSVRHYLITVPAGPVHVHGYLMCQDDNCVNLAISKMIGAAEDEGYRAFPPIVLVTNLDTGVEIVREIVGRHSEEAQRFLATATTFHFSGWMMPIDSADDKRLMELH